MRLNVYIAAGLGKQIERNQNLVEFKLAYFRLHTSAWKHIGQALGTTKTLRNFAV